MAIIKLFFALAVACGYTFAINYRQPSIMVVLLARNKEHALPYFLTLFEALDYPKHRMALYVRADHCEDNTIPILEKWLAAHGHAYHSLDVRLDKNSTLYPGESSRTEKGDSSYEGIIKLKEEALQKARKMWADYVFFLDVDVLITEPDLINVLLEENQPIVAPMLNSLGKYSNFWGGMSDEYWYVRTDQYLDILERKQKGCFTVPMVHSCVLVNLRVAQTDKLTFNPDVMPHFNLPLDDIITFAISAREATLEMTICNDVIYGFLTPPVVDKERPELDLLRLTSLKLEVLVIMPSLPVSLLLQEYVPPPLVKDKLGLDQLYLINLERRTDRRERMESCFTELGLQVKAIDAVDGKILTEDDLDKMQIQLLRGYKDPWAGRHMTFGEIGCFLSHFKVWKDVVDNGYETVLLFEDDIRFEPFFREHVASLLKHVEALALDWDLIYLGRKKLQSSDEPWVDESDRLVHVDYSYWTLCYLLTGRGAAKLLAAEPLQRLLPVDEFLPIMFGKHPEKEWSASFAGRDVKAFSVAPLLVYPTHYTGEEGYISDTEESTILPREEEPVGDSAANATAGGDVETAVKATAYGTDKGSRESEEERRPGSGSQARVPLGPDGLLATQSPSESIRKIDFSGGLGKDEL